jgi:hypothetical protein
VLIALAAALGWTLRQHWLEAQAHERAMFERAARARGQVFPPAQLMPPKPAAAAEFIDVAQHDVFSKDRNPNVVLDAPPPPPPPPPMPPLPSYYGQMAIGEPVILLSSPNEAQKRYHAGEKIGAFQIVSFDHEKIELKWNDKTIDRPLAELLAKERTPDPVVANAPDPTARPTGPTAAQVMTKTFGAAPQAEAPKLDPKIGTDMGAGNHACIQGETSPAGTEVNGYRKVIRGGLMGQTCFWESINK